MDVSPEASKPSPIALTSPLLVVVMLPPSSSSAVHSHALPIMSNALTDDSHALVPVPVAAPAKLHPDAGPDGVPEAAICHSVVVASRLLALAQACWA